MQFGDLSLEIPALETDETIAPVPFIDDVLGRTCHRLMPVP